MGTSQSAPVKKREDEEEHKEEDEDEDSEEEEEEWEEEEGDGELHEEMPQAGEHVEKQKNMTEKLEQESAMVPSSSSVSSVTAPHLGPSVRLGDPGHVLSFQTHVQSFNSSVGDELCTEIYLIRHGESSMNTLPDLIGGHSPSALLTAEGKRQARALGVFLLSHGLRFDAVFSSPLERSKQTAICVCQEVNFPQEKIELGDALMEISQGLWEGLRRSEVYTPDLINVMNNSQPDFHAPGGESQRQVEFRMVEFMNTTVLPKAVQANLQRDTGLYYNKKQSKSNPTMEIHPDKAAAEGKASGAVTNLFVKGSGKSRLQISSKGETSAAERLSSVQQLQVAPKAAPYCVAVFSHGMAIKCFLRGILGSGPGMTHKLRIDNTSMTVLKHSTYQGWQIQRVNDTSHLRLL